MRRFSCTNCSVATFPHTDKEESSFFLENCTWVWLDFLSDNQFFMTPEEFKTTLKT